MVADASPILGATSFQPRFSLRVAPVGFPMYDYQHLWHGTANVRDHEKATSFPFRVLDHWIENILYVPRKRRLASKIRSPKDSHRKEEVTGVVIGA